jgi:hypothetical protein
MNIVTLAQVKSELGITGSTNDDLINTFIDRVSRSIQSYIGYDLDERTEVQYDDGGDFDYFTLFPTTDIDSVVVEERDASRIYTIDLIDLRHIILQEAPYFGNKNVKISYKFGYPTVESIPEDLKGVAINWVNVFILDNNAKKEGEATAKVIKTEKIEDIQITYFSKGELESLSSGGALSGSLDKQVLDSYKICQQI